MFQAGHHEWRGRRERHCIPACAGKTDSCSFRINDTLEQFNESDNQRNNQRALSNHRRHHPFQQDYFGGLNISLKTKLDRFKVGFDRLNVRLKPKLDCLKFRLKVCLDRLKVRPSCLP